MKMTRFLQIFDKNQRLFKILNENDQFSEFFPWIFDIKILKFCTKMVKFLDISWNFLDKFFILDKKINFG